MTTDREVLSWLHGVHDYAEWEQGLDPIGAGDMLRALQVFSRQRYGVTRKLEAPADIWTAFRASSEWERFYPKRDKKGTGE